MSAIGLHLNGELLNPRIFLDFPLFIGSAGDEVGGQQINGESFEGRLISHPV